MLYLIGGPARSGKTLLARRLLQLRQVPYFCTDYLTSGLEAGALGLGVRHELTSRARGERMWPVLAGVLRNVVEVEPEYVVEGDSLLPSKIAGFAADHGGRVRAYFLGYARCSLEAKCAFIRSFPSPVNDWIAGMPEEALCTLVSEMRQFSEFLEADCQAHALRYFDGSGNFSLAIEEAQEYLLAAGAAEQEIEAEAR